MTFKDLIQMVLGNLGRMRWRTALTASGVVIGTTALVLLVSLGVGLQRMMTDQLTKRFGTAAVITVFPSMVEFQGPTGPRPSTERQAKLDEDAVERFEALPDVDALLRNLQTSVSRTRLRHFEGPGFSVVATDKEALRAFGFKIARGRSGISGEHILVGAQVPKLFFDSRKNRPIRDLGLAGKRVDVFIQKNVGIQMGGPPAPGENQEYKWRAKVAGVLKSAGPEYDSNIYLSNRQARKLSRYLPREARDQYASVKVKVRSADKVTSTQRRIDKMGFTTMSLTDFLKGINTVFVIVQAVLGGVASIALLVAAFGIANTMTMAIYERTREIGIMKAVGAAGTDIMRVFLVEAATIGFSGGLGGVVLGFLGGKVINLGLSLYYAEQMKDIKGGIIATPVWLVLFTLIFATGVGLVSGIFPASRASRLSPLGALRHE